MSVPYILPLSKAQDASLVGGKAVNLCHLIENQFPVPDGFVVTTAAYQYAHNSGNSMPDDLKEATLQAYQAMGAPPVAVRSSATAEDGASASMAGQYETFLDIQNGEQLIEAIQKCWASLNTARTRAYLAENNIALEQVSMAVVVQQLIDADVAGVLFTTNPHTQSKQELSIEASWGLGESVVSGIVQPDNITLDNTTGKVVRYQVSRKEVEIRAQQQGTQMVPSERQHLACLTDTALNQLWQLAQQLVQYFKRPQDVEWALRDGTIYLLQSRPITTLSSDLSPEKLLPQIKTELETALEKNQGPWVRHNLGETLPCPTPLTWSVIQRFMSGQGGYGNLYRHVGFQPSEQVYQEGFLKLIGGQIYMDTATAGEMFWQGYPFAYDIEKLKADPNAAQLPPSIPQGTYSELKNAQKQAQQVNQKLSLIAEDLEASLEKDIFPQFAEWCAKEKAVDLTALSHEALIALWKKREQHMLDEFAVHAFLPSLIEANTLMQLHEFLEMHFWDDKPDNLVHKLESNVTADKTTQSNSDLYQVAQGKLSIDVWLSQYGHRAPEEFDLATPRWRERPEAIQQLAAQLKDGTNPATAHTQRQQTAQAFLSELKAQVSPSIQTQLDEHVKLLNHYLRFREDSKYYLMLGYDLLRDLALEAGRRLNLGDYIFYLTQEELFQSLATGQIELISLHKREQLHRAYRRLDLPHLIDNAALDTWGTPTQQETAASFQGLTVSSGQAQGIAKIVHSPEAATDLGEDYILVCPSTDPSWTPLFINAKAIILERGGALSHGAVVAREMGIPAIVYPGATTRIVPDQKLWVNGDKGTLYFDEADITASDEAEANTLTPASKPPVVSLWEKKALGFGIIMASLWGVYLALAFILPEAWLYTPSMQIIDSIIWPLVPLIGMQATVVAIAVFFGATTMIGQRFMTDNARLLVAKKRSAELKNKAATLPEGDPQRHEMEALAAPITKRLLKASLVPIATVLGPMFMVFFWIPDRLAPNAWNADPGSTVSVVATIAGDYTEPVTLEVTEPLTLDSLSPAAQTLPPIRETLETLQQQWQEPSDLSQLSWDTRAAALQTRHQFMNSLEQYLQKPIPAQTLTWIIRAPAETVGHFPLNIVTANEETISATLSLGRDFLPMPTEIENTDNTNLFSLKLTYPLSSTKKIFWAPLPNNQWDAGWLWLYLIAYLPAMFFFKLVFRVS